VEFEKRRLDQDDDGKLGTGGLVDRSKIPGEEATKRQRRD